LAWVMANPDWEKQEKCGAKPGPKKKEIETDVSISLRGYPGSRLMCSGKRFCLHANV
jgi:hypothetical protein